jgi:hypothetical protein
MKIFYSILVLAFVCTVTRAETVRLSEGGVDVTVTLSPTEITVGDLISLHIEAFATADFSLTLTNNDTYGAFTVINRQQLLDIPTDAGDWASKNGESGTLSIPPIGVAVDSVAGKSLQTMSIRDIKGAIPLLSNSSLLAFVASGATGIALIFLLVRFFHRNKPALSPHNKAVLAISQLKHANLAVQPFYTTLSDIVRHYLEGRFQIHATGQTTREFLNEAKRNTRLEHSDRESLGTFLVAADLVKFARHEPTKNVNEDAIHQAEIFIKETSEEPV